MGEETKKKKCKERNVYCKDFARKDRGGVEKTSQACLTEFEPIDFFERGQEQLIEETFVRKTAKFVLNIHYRHLMVSYETLKQYVVSEKAKIAMCSGQTSRLKKPCANYQNSWSCPPYAPSLDNYNNKKFKYCLLYCTWIDWDELASQIASKNKYFVLINANRTLNPWMWHYGQKLERVLGGKDMIDGRCPLCLRCEAKFGRPCKHPKARRSSLEALGLHATRLCKDFLKHEIQWYRSFRGVIETPKWVTCIHGLLTNSLQPKGMIK